MATKKGVLQRFYSPFFTTASVYGILSNGRLFVSIKQTISLMVSFPVQYPFKFAICVIYILLIMCVCIYLLLYVGVGSPLYEMMLSNTSLDPNSKGIIVYLYIHMHTLYVCIYCYKRTTVM